MAFVPFQERPLQTWFIAFFKAVYSPTQFLWQKKARTPEFLITKPVSVVKKAPIAPQVVAGKQKLTEYLATLPSQPTPLDQQEAKQLEQLGSLFASAQLPSSLTPTAKPLPEAEMPAGVRIRKLHGPLVVEEESTYIGTRPTAPSPPEKKIEPKFTPQIVPPAKRKREGKPAIEAKFSQEISMPNTPTIPNILVGMVLDTQGKTIEGAIIEIRDLEGNPVRAFRSSKLGQFMIATSLTNGTYEIETEKEGYQFDLIKLSLTGAIVPPIEIRAKKEVPIAD